jgi:hypothetical protein
MKKGNKDILDMDNFKVKVVPNFPALNFLDSPQMQEHLKKSSEMLKRAKMPQ